MDVTYSNDKKQSAQDVAAVFKRSGIKRPHEDHNRIQRMIDHSDVLITAWIDDNMIGVARAITDYSYCCYLSDLAVDLDYQKHGIGKELVKRVQDKIGEECSEQRSNSADTPAPPNRIAGTHFVQLKWWDVRNTKTLCEIQCN